MRALSKWLLAVGVAAIIACPVMAQGKGKGGGFGGRGGMFGGGLGQLLNNESVKKELKITEEQSTKIAEAVQSVRAKHADEMAGFRDLDREEMMAKMAKLAPVISKETYAALSDVLKPEQTKRLKQIELQQQYLQAFTLEDVQKSLKLTDDEKDKIKTIAKDEREEMANRRPPQDAEPEARAAAMKKIAELRKEFLAKGVAVLTDDQKKEWKEMNGEPFELVQAAGGNFGKGKGNRKKKADN